MKHTTAIDRWKEEFGTAIFVALMVTDDSHEVQLSWQFYEHPMLLTEAV